MVDPNIQKWSGRSDSEFFMFWFDFESNDHSIEEEKQTNKILFQIV